MLKNAAASSSRSSNSSKSESEFRVIHTGKALIGLSQAQAFQRLLGIINPETQDKTLDEMSRLELAASSFKTILDDNSIPNKLAYLNDIFAEQYQDSLTEQPMFISQLSHSLSAHYNRFIHPISSSQPRSQEDLYQNIAVREKKILGTHFLKQYIDKDNVAHGDVYLSLNIILIMNNIETIRECLKLLLEPSLEPLGADYLSCLSRVKKAIAEVKAIEEELSPIMKVALIISRGKTVDEQLSNLEASEKCWVDRKEDIERMSQNLYQLYLSFLHYSVYNAQLLSILGDYEEAHGIALEAKSKANWALDNVQTLLSKTTFPEKSTREELLRNKKQSEEVLTLIEQPNQIHSIQHSCFKYLLSHNLEQARTLSANIIEKLQHNLPEGENATYPEKFLQSLNLWAELLQCSNKAALEEGYRHWLKWQLWFCGLKNSQILSGKICQVSLTEIGLNLKTKLQAAIAQHKKVEEDLVRQHKEAAAREAAESLLQDEKKRQEAQLKKRKLRRKAALERKARQQEERAKTKAEQAVKKEKAALERKAEQAAQAKLYAEQQKKQKEAKAQKQAKALERKKAKQARKKAKRQLRKQKRENIEFKDTQKDAVVEKTDADISLSTLSDEIDLLTLSTGDGENDDKAIDDLQVDFESLDIEEQPHKLEDEQEISSQKCITEQWIAQRCVEALLPQILISKNIYQLMAKIEAKGYFVSLYGGFVRDSLMRIRANDHDLVTNCPIEILREIGPFASTYRNNCFTLGPYIDITVLSDYDLVAFSESRYLAANALFATKEGKVFAATDEIYPLINSPYLMPTRTKTIKASFIEDPSRILRCIYYTSHTGRPLTPETLGAMTSCANEIMKKTPFGVLKARIGDIFLRGRALPNLTFLYQNKLAHHIVPQPNEEIDSHVYQFISKQLYQADVFVVRDGVRTTRNNIFALLLFPYYQSLLSVQHNKHESCPEIAVETFCNMFSEGLMSEADKKPFIKRVSATICEYERLFLHFKADRLREQELLLAQRRTVRSAVAASSSGELDNSPVLTVQFRPETEGENIITVESPKNNTEKPPKEQTIEQTPTNSTALTYAQVAFKAQQKKK